MPAFAQMKRVLHTNSRTCTWTCACGWLFSCACVRKPACIANQWRPVTDQAIRIFTHPMRHDAEHTATLIQHIPVVTSICCQCKDAYVNEILNSASASFPHGERRVCAKKQFFNFWINRRCQNKKDRHVRACWFSHGIASPDPGRAFRAFLYYLIILCYELLFHIPARAVKKANIN